ncbi:hypothetical protein OKA04_12660 [Luteolibacter flavescens]|uniref:Uncharacterized protein n=1 Tax=Luteolibacter flavescens TaxID=1859460 RepID=A0ABT3FPS6_9BACT|nr:hypothetical protein [Luteolibacter flavescens]MCW1885583.1 hypothetical protein [Luteolibacter flavescens]
MPYSLATSRGPSTRPSARLGGLCSDLAAGLRQQMVYWGRDVVHPHGNLLAAQGFRKSKSPGLQTSSCYALEWEGGRIELHGACAGWFPEDGSAGFLFIRPLGRSHVWKGGTAPVPGEWPAALLDSTDFPRVLDLARPFLRWWMESEAWILDLLGPSYRDSCHRHLKRLPKGQPWLHPAVAMAWVAQLHSSGHEARRARRFTA